ncbi:MAG TPA: hypothetical protein PLX97_08990, partial [Gemmatales bacterium]|nr:hypothetical protein [Gemmatales bacterium]
MAIIVNCPACGTPASIEPNFYGKKLRCANADCRQTFRVQSDGSVAMDGGRPETPRSYDWQNPPAQEAMEGDWLAAPPPRPGQEMPMASVIQQPMAQVVPMGQVMNGGDEDEDEGSSYSPGDYNYGRKKNKFLVILIGLVVLLIVGLGFGYWLLKQNTIQAVAQLKKKYDSSMDKKLWDDAITAGRLFLDKQKEARDSTDVKEVEFGVNWAELQMSLRA